MSIPGINAIADVDVSLGHPSGDAKAEGRLVRRFNTTREDERISGFAFLDCRCSNGAYDRGFGFHLLLASGKPQSQNRNKRRSQKEAVIGLSIGNAHTQHMIRAFPA